jgi:hypothetical protein
MISQDFHLMCCSLKKVLEFLQPTNNCQQLLVMNFIIALHIIGTFGDEAHGVPLVIIPQLGKDSTCGKIRAVCL